VTKTCEVCGFACNICNNATDCTDCQAPYVNNNGTCGCQEQYILLLNGTCILDPISSNPCNMKPYIWVTNGSCTDDCGAGFYLEVSSNICRGCGPGCTTCTDNSSCIICGPGFVLNHTSV